MFAYVSLLALVAAAVAIPAPDQFYSAKMEEPKPADYYYEDRLTEHTFITQLDHFRPQDSRTVEFTYTQNTEFFGYNGPIFIYVGDGGFYTTEWLQGGLMYDIAREQHAALFTADHRYFGKNIPTPTASFDDLQYLSVDQALGDLAVLINTIRQSLPTSGRVVLWGTGYGASLAANARKKFPHLVDGVFASSAYFRADAIDTTYYDQLSMIIRENGGQECGDRVRFAFAEFEELVLESQTEYIHDHLRLCEPLDVSSPQEIGIIAYRYIDLIAQYIHFNHLNGLQNFCRDMNAYPYDPLNSLIRWIEYVYGGRSDCTSLKYSTLLAGLQRTNWTELTGTTGVARAADYLVCTQLGGLRVSADNTLEVFPADLITEEYQYQFCRDVFGEEYDADLLAGAVDLLNFSYGGQDQRITNVVFSNAGLDPLITHGIADFDAINSEVVFLRYSAAGADLRSQTSYDSLDLVHAKERIRELVVRWSTYDPLFPAQA